MRAKPSSFQSLFAFLILASAALAQSPASALDPQIAAAQNVALDALAQNSLDAATKALFANPPALKESPERRLALLLIDAALAEPAAAERKRVKEFHKAQIEGAVNEMENATVTKGAKVWKLYGDGFVVRTPTATLAFDIVMAGGVKAKEFAPWQDVYDRLARQCDALCVSSVDALHADPAVAERFVKAGKPVYVPKGLWGDKQFAGSLAAMGPTAEMPFEVFSERYTGFAFAAPDAPVPSVHYIFAPPDGVGIARVTAPIAGSAWAEFEKRGRSKPAAILLAGAGLSDIPRLAKTFGAQAVLVGGEHDLAQDFPARITHGAVHKKLRLSPAPFVAMAWGEAFDFAP